VLDSGNFLTFVWPDFVPANYGPTNNTLDTFGGSGSLLSTDTANFVFGTVTFAQGGFYSQVTANVGSYALMALGLGVVAMARRRTRRG
jgi:hypothetical protein